MMLAQVPHFVEQSHKWGQCGRAKSLESWSQLCVHDKHRNGDLFTVVQLLELKTHLMLKVAEGQHLIVRQSADVGPSYS